MGMTDPMVVQVGSHNVAEIDRPDGFETVASCDDPNESSGSTSVDVNVPLDTAVECEFVNTLQHGFLTLSKVVQEWSFKGTGPFGLNVSDFVPLLNKEGQTVGPVPVPVGEYTIIEETQPGYIIASIECLNGEGESVGSPAADGDGINFDLPAGDSIVCTFINLGDPDTPDNVDGDNAIYLPIIYK